MEKLINQPAQGTESWHDWRNKGLGASEAPIVMGESPYQTPFQLWETKTKRKPPQATNFAMTRGNNLEKKARASFELTHDIEMEPMLAEYAPWPIARASFDGFNKKLNAGLEIKCCGKKNFEMVKNGQVPLDYRAQIQQQILVSGAEKVFLYAFDGEAGVTLEVVPDVEYCKKLLEELKKFWDCVKNDIPPELDPTRDFEVIDDENLHQYVTDWKVIKTERDRIQRVLDALEEKMKSGLQVDRAICNGVRFTKSYRKGGINYNDIPVLKDVDLEKFRKPNIETFKISLLKEK